MFTNRFTNIPTKAKPTFEPFRATILCPGCNRPLHLMVQKAHLEISIHCPRCGRPLTSLVRAEIEKKYLRYKD